MRTNEQILEIDPFVTRPPLWRLLLGRLRSNEALVAATVPRCDFVLVTHAHYDHLMDVPEVIRQTRAAAFGSPNTWQVLALLGVPEENIHEIKVEDRFPLGHFQVEILPAEHLKVPGFPPDPLPLRLRPPLRMWGYQMDTDFGFLIEVGGLRFLDWSSERVEPALPADVLLVKTRDDCDKLISVS